MGLHVQGQLGGWWNLAWECWTWRKMELQQSQSRTPKPCQANYPFVYLFTYTIFLFYYKITQSYRKIVWNTYVLNSTHFNVLSYLLQILFSQSLICENYARFPLSLTDCTMKGIDHFEMIIGSVCQKYKNKFANLIGMHLLA